jgi:hypothetical protein
MDEAQDLYLVIGVLVVNIETRHATFYTNLNRKRKHEYYMKRFYALKITNMEAMQTSEVILGKCAVKICISEKCAEEWIAKLYNC